MKGSPSLSICRHPGAGIIYVSASDLGWQPIKDAWMLRRPEINASRQAQWWVLKGFFFFFRFFKEMQVIWLVDLQWNMLVPRCIEPCRVVWTCQVNLDTHLLDPSTTNTVHSWASARCQCWGWQFCCLRKTQPDLGNFHWQGRGGHLGPSVWQVRLLGVGQSEAMDCQFGTGRNSTRSSYPWLKGAVFLVPWKTTSCPK